MKKEAFWNKIFPWLMLLLVAALVYLPLAGQLGYYKDDWHVAWSGTVRGAGSVIDLHLNDRPGMGVVYAGLFAILGNAPLNWQLYAIFIRVVGGCLFLWILWLINRDFKRENLLAALLFVVYPGFLQLPNASSYQCHLTGLAFGLFSIALSLQVLFTSSKIWRAGLALLSALFAAACYFMMEYMIGLEGLRLVLLAYLFYPRFNAIKKTLLKTLQYWLPNLTALIAFLSWRLLFFKSARSVTDVGLLSQSYLTDPFGMLLRFVFETLKGYVNALLGAWMVPFYQVTNRAAYVDLAVSLGLAIVVLLVLRYYWKHVPLQDQGKLHPAPLMLIGAGLLGALLPLLPIILSYRQVEFQDTFDRYTLPASMGVMMVVIGLSLLINSRARLWVFGVLISFSMITQYNNGAYFRDFWNYQRQTWWQLSWRAPDIEDGSTLVAMLPQGYRLAESYEIWAPANLIYRPGEQTLKIAGEAINQDTLAAMLTGQSYGKTMRRVDVKIDFKNMLVLNYPPGGSCLHVMDGQRAEFPENTDPQVLLIAHLSRPDLISGDAQPKQPPQAIFGAEPEHNWCYYYQKASLARQNADWKTAAALGDEALALGLSPADASEWMPFYEAYAREKRYNEANLLGGYLRETPYFINMYCAQFKTDDASSTIINTEDRFVVENLCPDLLNKE